jgi:hypothetical protein
VQTPSSSSYSKAGPVVSPSHPAIHRLVHLTAMHATFTLQSVQDWALQDRQRQEAGSADSLTYLVNSMRFLMTVTERNQSFARLCREEKAKQEHIVQGIESAFAVLKSINLDTADAEAQCHLLHFRIKQLEASAISHDGSVAEMAELFNGLQERIDAVTRVSGRVTSPSRPN